MSSNSAIESQIERGGVGWQVDLPGLASLVLNLGASGLKRFAQAGVDFHTILCMGEIAEKCPASNEYRRELTVCRQEQRKQSQWLYRLVEIGAATNFVADELLKLRAGENVVALMSTILPVMSESACDGLLLRLFEASGAPLDRTPGFGQLKSIRDTLIPLARKAYFKDKVYQYYLLSKQLLEDAGSSNVPSAFESIPNCETATQVILALSKIVQEDQRLILEYHGFKGSAWVITYARHVLGLPVCILKSISNPVPINGDFHTARVLVHIHGGGGVCKMSMKGEVQDLFVTDNVDGRGQDGWSIDVDRINLFDSHIPLSSPLRSTLIFIASSMVNERTSFLAQSTRLDTVDTPDDLRVPGLVGYAEYCLPAIQQRAQTILRLFGFEAANVRNATFGGLRPYFSKKNEIFPNFSREVLCLEMWDGVNVTPGPAWLASGLGHVISKRQGQSTENLSDPQASRTEAVFTEKTKGYLAFVFAAAEAASWLALTNWDQHIRSVSTTMLETKARSRESELNFFAADLSSIAQVTMEILIGRHQGLDANFEDEDLLAYYSSGFVFCNATAATPALDLNACFLHGLPGSIVAHGERCKRVSTISQDLPIIEVGAFPAARGSTNCGPVDKFPGIKVSNHINLSGNTVNLYQSAEIRGELTRVFRPEQIYGALRRLRVTSGCNHGYFATDDPDLKDRINLGLRNGTVSGETYVQAVDQNAVGQWLAFQNSGFNVLQRNCCLKCTIHIIDPCLKTLHDKYTSPDRISGTIIFGRLPGEEME